MEYNEFKVLVFEQILDYLDFEDHIKKLYENFNCSFMDSREEPIDERKNNGRKKDLIKFDKQAIEKLNENKNLKLDGLGFKYDKHLYKAFQLGLLTIDQLKKVSSNSVNINELENFDSYIYLARCTGKLMNFRDQFINNRNVTYEF